MNNSNTDPEEMIHKEILVESMQEDIQEIRLDIRTIKNCVLFFTILTVISLVGTFILGIKIASILK